jgi:Na+/glutamate symporter
MVVQELRYLQAILRFGPVTKHYGDSTQHLNMHPVVVALLYTAVAAPAVVFNLAEEFIALHHPCAARLVVL